MRRPARSLHPLARRPAVPAQSRVTANRAVAALRRTRHAIEEIEVELDGILDDLQGRRRLDRAAPDRLRASANEARAAMASLNDFADLYG